MDDNKNTFKKILLIKNDHADTFFSYFKEKKNNAASL